MKLEELPDIAKLQKDMKRDSGITTPEELCEAGAARAFIRRNLLIPAPVSASCVPSKAQ